MKKIFVFILFMIFLVVNTSNIIFAKTTPSDEVLELVYFSDDEDLQYYVSNDELFLIKPNYSPKEKIVENKLSSQKVARIEKSEIVFDVYSNKLSKSKINLLKSASSTALGVLLRNSSQGMTKDGSITVQLTVAYTQSGNRFYLDSATGSYFHNSYSSGIVGKSSNLYYLACGCIYKNGKFLRNGSIGFNRDYATPTFNSIPLMSPNEYVEDTITAGVTYTLYCTRGVSAVARIQFY